MNLTEKERIFVDNRRKLTASWPYIGSLLLAAVVLLAGWLFWSSPLLINPLYVFNRLEAEAIETPTLLLMAGILPIVMLMCIFILVSVLLISFSAFSNERKLIDIVTRLSGEKLDNSNT